MRLTVQMSLARGQDYQLMRYILRKRISEKCFFRQSGSITSIVNLLSLGESENYWSLKGDAVQKRSQSKKMKWYFYRT